MADVACAYPFGWDRRLGREETLWMITEMGWTPETFPNSGHTAMMRCQFLGAIAFYNLHDALREAEAQRDAVAAPSIAVNPWADTAVDEPAEAVVDPWANTAEAGMEQVEVGSQSSTELVPSDADDADLVLVDLPESTVACPVFDLSP